MAIIKLLDEDINLKQQKLDKLRKIRKKLDGVMEPMERHIQNMFETSNIRAYEQLIVKYYSYAEHWQVIVARIKVLEGAVNGLKRTRRELLEKKAAHERKPKPKWRL